MRKVLTVIMVVTLMLAFVAASAYAGGYGESKKMGKQTSQLLKANDLIGKSVHNMKGEELGRISDLAVDPESGKVTFAVLAAGGILGIGEKLIPVPMSALQISEGKVTLDISKEKLASAPTFDKEQWTEMTNRQQMENTYRYFGVRPYWEEEGTMMEKEKTYKGSEKEMKEKEKGKW